MELQHINVKLIFNESLETDLEPLIPIFHDWISEQNSGELLIDVADYRHVPDGRGIILIGHETNISIAENYGATILCYNRKITTEGTDEERFRQSVRGALAACEKIEKDGRLTGKINFECQEIEILVNDRIYVSNQEKFHQEIDPKFKDVCEVLFINNNYSITHSEDPRELYSIRLKADLPLDKKTILKTL